MVVFAHVILKKTLVIRRAKKIQARINRRIDLWERVIHPSLVGEAEAEGTDREGRADRGIEGEEEDLSLSFYSTVLYANLRQAVWQTTNREGVGCILPDEHDQIPGDRLQRSSGRSTRIRESPLWKIPRVQPSNNTRKYLKRDPLT